MRIDGEHRLRFPRPEVWVHLHNPDLLREAIPGCTAFTEVAPDTYELTAETAVGPVRGVFTGSVALRDAQHDTRFTLVATGRGRPGSVSGEAVIDLEDDGSGTRLRYEADVTIRGAVARVGGRLLAATARVMARQFFDVIEQRAQVAAERGAGR